MRWSMMIAGLCLFWAPATVDADTLPPTDNPPALILSIDDAIDEPQTAVPGQPITYTLVFTNIGDRAITNVRLVALVPEHTRRQDGVTGSWACAIASGLSQVLCSMAMDSLAPQAAGVADLVVTIDNPLPPTIHAIVMEASVNADEVVCGECGYAQHTTAVDPDQNQYPNTFSLFLPSIVRRAN